MNSSGNYNLRRWTLIVGAAVLVFGIGLPFLQPVLLPAAGGLGTSILWITIIPVSLIVGITGIVLGSLRSVGDAASYIRILFLFISGLHLSFLVFVNGSLFWNTLIGPSAKIVVADDFEGRFRIAISDFTEPSIATSGKEYLYQIPENGELQVARGWIAVHFAFENEYNVSGGRYSVQIIRRNGIPLKGDEFTCSWLAEPIVRGIACDIRPMMSSPSGNNEVTGD